MKILARTKPYFVFILMLLFGTSTNAQFLKKLGKRAQKAAERTVERRVERETSKKTDQTLDSILEPGKNGKQTPPNPNTTDGPSGQKNGNGDPNTENEPGNNTLSESEQLKVYSKFDFVPGDKQLFFDDFANDFIGDLPASWNTNAGGEVVSMGEPKQKWFELKSGYNIFYIPDVPELPQDYTIEFDVMGMGVDRASSTSHLRVDISDDSKFKEGSNFVQAAIPFCQYTPVGITIENNKNNKREIRSTIKADIRDAILNGAHISIAVNGERFRLWVNEFKYIDVPRMVPTSGRPHTLKFHANNFEDGTERIFMTNLKVAEGGSDLRKKLISEGKISTNGILFDSGSDNIKPESMGIIRQIYQVMQQDSNINLKIVGHTDSDGADDSNLTLSKNRADSVKNTLIEVYGVDESRLTTEGKGEMEPVTENSSPEGKAQNRRVEFIKQ